MLRLSKVMSCVVVFIFLFILTASFSFAEEANDTSAAEETSNVKETSGISVKIIDKIYKDYKITILESTDNWYKISINDKSGWLYGSYVPVAEPDDTETSEIVDETQSTDSNDQETTESTESTGDKDQETVESTEDTDNIGEVEDETLIPTTSNSDAETRVVEKGVINASNLNIREDAGTEYSVVGQLDRGEQIDITGRKLEWYQIETSSGVKGWVYGTYVLVGSTATSRGEDVIDHTLVVPSDIAEENTSDQRTQIVEYAKKLQGVRYVYGGNTPKEGFDCSGFVKYVFDHFGIKLERVAASQAKQGKWVSKANLKPGDIVFFDTNGGMNHINHVGIYIGNGSFIHASSGRTTKKVVISDLTSGFYNNCYMTGRRVVE